MLGCVDCARLAAGADVARGAGAAWMGGGSWLLLGGGCTVPVTTGSGACPGWYDAMPRPPPEVPGPIATVAGRFADGGGNWDVCTRLTGAVWPLTDPVTSLWPLRDE